MALDVTGSYTYPNPKVSWLAQHVEEIIEPDLPLVDSHHHIWNQTGNEYLIDDLCADVMTGHNIRATVAIQAHYGYRDGGPEAFRCVGETEKIETAANQALKNEIQFQPCAAVVSFADLMLGEKVIEVLDAHRHASPLRFKGVRHGVARDPNFPNGIVLRPAAPNMLAEPNFRAGMSTLAKSGLSFDAMLYHCQIKELSNAAEAVPDLPIVLDHFGCIIGVGPYEGREKETFNEWAKDIKLLAKSPNVSIKLGGMGMIICGAKYHERAVPPSSLQLAQDWRPFVETCIEAFGVDRCMFESNFPVDKAMFSYAVLWNAFKRLTHGASEQEKSKLLCTNALNFYKLYDVLSPRKFQ
jgi:predicted TIM-barrel fold metal-dependent hydrolase